MRNGILILLLFIPTVTWSQPYAFEGWALENFVGRESGVSTILEEHCSSPVVFNVGSDLHWTLSESSYACATRETGSSGHSLLFDPAASMMDTSPRPLVPAGTGLYEVYDEDEGQVLRVGGLVIAPNQRFALSGIHGPENADISNNFRMDLLVTPASSPSVANLNGTYRFMFSAEGFDTSDDLVMEQGLLLVTFDGQGGCTFVPSPQLGLTGNLDSFALLYSTLSGSGSLGNRELSVAVSPATASMCSYTIDANDHVQVSWMEDGENETETLLVSDDFSLLTLARRISEANEGIEGMVLAMKEPSSNLSNADLNGHFALAQVSKTFFGSGSGHPDGIFDNQQTNNFIRGRFEFDSTMARTGPSGEAGYAACQYEVRAEQSTQFASGAPGASVATGFGASQSNRFSDDCVYRVSQNGDVSIVVTETAQETAFMGHVSADGEVLGLIARDNTDISEAGFPGLSLEATFHSAVAVRYGGDWDLDADADGITNYQEWVFPNNNGEDVFALSSVEDFSGNGLPEIAALETTSELDIRVVIGEGSSGAILSNNTFLSNGWRATDLVQIPGISNGRAAVGVAAVGRSNDLPIIQLKDAQNGQLLRNLFPWSAAWEVLDSKVAPSLVPGGGDAVATLAVRRSDGLPGVELRDPSNGSLIRLIYPLGFGWAPMQMEFLTAGAPAVAVLHTRDSDGLAIVQVRNATNNTVIRNVFPLGLGWSPIELNVVPDLNSNNADEIAVRMTRDSDGLEIIQLRDSLTNALVLNVYPIGAGAGGWSTRQFGVVDDGGTPRLAILSVRDTDGQVLLQTRNLSTAGVVRNTFFIAPPNLYQNAMTIVADYSGNNASEVGVLVRNSQTGSRFIQVRDIATSAVIRNIFQP